MKQHANFVNMTKRAAIKDEVKYLLRTCIEKVIDSVVDYGAHLLYLSQKQMGYTTCVLIIDVSMWFQSVVYMSFIQDRRHYS